MIGCISASAARKTIAVTRSREQTDTDGRLVRTQFRVEELDGGGVHLGVERQQLGAARAPSARGGGWAGAEPAGNGQGAAHVAGARDVVAREDVAVPLDVHDVAVEPARRLAEVDGGLLQRRDDRLHLVKLDALPRVLRAARRERRDY